MLFYSASGGNDLDKVVLYIDLPAIVTCLNKSNSSILLRHYDMMEIFELHECASFTWHILIVFTLKYVHFSELCSITSLYFLFKMRQLTTVVRNLLPLCLFPLNKFLEEIYYLFILLGAAICHSKLENFQKALDMEN